MAFEVKTIMFDLDGTLLHTAPEIANAANKMLIDLQIPALTESRITEFIGDGVQTLIRRCLSNSYDSDVNETLFERAQRIYTQYYAENVAQSQPFYGVVDGLKQLHERNIRLACVTNKPAKFTTPLLKKSGLADFFDAVISGDTLAKKKPDPIQLLHICAKFQIAPHEAMLVGDSANDIEAAWAAGCLMVGVSYGYNQGRALDQNRLNAMINDLTELTFLLD